MSNIREDIEQLTGNISDVPAKTHLRPVLAESLRSLGHDEGEVAAALSVIFQEPTIQ